MRLYLLAALILLTIPSAAHAQGLRADMRESIVCTMDAKICPDGSAVSRTEPNCEFALCPGETSLTPPPEETYPTEEGTITPDESDGVDGAPGVIEGSSGVTGFAVPHKQPPMLPDNPLQGDVQEPVTVQFLIKHRLALNGKKIKVHGIVLWALPANKDCGIVFTMLMLCAHRGMITLADHPQDTHDISHAFTILLPETDKTPYATGQILDVSGTVIGDAYGVTMMKE